MISTTGIPAWVGDLLFGVGVPSAQQAQSRSDMDCAQSSNDQSAGPLLAKLVDVPRML